MPLPKTEFPFLLMSHFRGILIKNKIKKKLSVTLTLLFYRAVILLPSSIYFMLVVIIFPWLRIPLICLWVFSFFFRKFVSLILLAKFITFSFFVLSILRFYFVLNTQRSMYNIYGSFFIIRFDEGRERKKKQIMVILHSWTFLVFRLRLHNFQFCDMKIFDWFE